MSLWANHRCLHMPNLTKSNIQQLKDEIREKLPPDTTAQVLSTTCSSLSVPGTGTLRHSHKKNKPAPPPPTGLDGGTPAKPAPNLPIRNPSELLVGVPSTLTTQWRHRPEELVTGCITYVANYLGSTVVKELKGTESTKKSIQKLKKTSKELTTTPDIMLAISYRGVKFLNTGTQELVCEHEIRNIHCACQDADDLTHFAYITKDHISRSHYCHVFCVETMDQATEVILTLGQAFEVAYQITLREQITGSRRNNGHTRSQSANHIVPNVVSLSNSNHTQQTTSNHSRSLSVNECLKTAQLTTNESRGTDGEKAPLVVTEDL
ncbi:hypothetical protein RUM44_007996 [Polyplax serrata]|uniref:PID domain-containing protein n=1 Tax=Polyplax serrata TaxID=468196 RepID=A0ABR1BB36_POLSC